MCTFLVIKYYLSQEYKDYRDAEDAVKDCNGREFFGHR